ncbi:MAG TPA: tetratricopeptide repeat protein [Vicinamibacteria bacterium]
MAQITGARGRGDRARALRLYERACAAGHGPGCRDGALLQRETPDAERLLQMGCDHGDAGSCRDLMVELRSGSRDPARSEGLFRRAAELYEKGCRGGRGVDCLELGRLHARVAPPDEARAAAFQRQGTSLLAPACERGDGEACFELGIAYHEGTGVEADLRRHLALMERACTLGELRGCAERAAVYLDTEAPDDDAQAPALFERACRGGVLQQSPCRQAGFLYVEGRAVPADKARGLPLLEAGCAQGDAESCWMASGMWREGDGVAADAGRAAALLQGAAPAEIKVVSVKRARQAPDPTAAQMGVDPSEMPPVRAAAGQDLIVVTLEVRRPAAGGAGLPVRSVWVLDRQGRRHPSVLKADLPLGQEEHETRDMVFVVPAGTRPVQVHFELGALTFDLPKT